LHRSAGRDAPSLFTPRRVQRVEHTIVAADEDGSLSHGWGRKDAAPRWEAPQLVASCGVNREEDADAAADVDDTVHHGGRRVHRANRVAPKFLARLHREGPQETILPANKDCSIGCDWRGGHRAGRLHGPQDRRGRSRAPLSARHGNEHADTRERES
jgi:hypothetical protein